MTTHDLESTGFKADLLGLADFAYQRLRGRLDGLTDEEYFWEPAPGCWSIRKQADGTFKSEGSSFVPSEPPPLTTLAWRLSHLIWLLQGERNATWIGVTPTASGLDRSGDPGTAEEAISQLEQAFVLFRGHVEQVVELAAPIGEVAGPYGKDTRASFILHELDELIHHGSEIACMRDVYRATRPMAPFVIAALEGSRDAMLSQLSADPSLREQHAVVLPMVASRGLWETAKVLVEQGFEINAPGQVSVLHYAAGHGNREMVELLLAHGADKTAVEPRYGATPKGWAEYFHASDVADLLE